MSYNPLITHDCEVDMLKTICITHLILHLSAVQGWRQFPLALRYPKSFMLHLSTIYGVFFFYEVIKSSVLRSCFLCQSENAFSLFFGGVFFPNNHTKLNWYQPLQNCFIKGTFLKVAPYSFLGGPKNPIETVALGVHDWKTKLNKGVINICYAYMLHNVLLRWWLFE